MSRILRPGTNEVASQSSPVVSDGPHKQTRVVPLILALAFGALAFTGASGIVVYTNTQHVISVRGWLEHTHEVLSALQSQSQSLDRVGYTIQLYEAKGDAADLRAAQGAIAAMELRATAIQRLVQDNPSQTRHAHDLEVAVQKLSQAMDYVRRTQNFPESEILANRSVIATIQDEERGLLKQRTDESERTAVRTLLLESVFLGLSLLVVLSLFAFLLRDALNRRSSDGKLSSTIDALKRRSWEAVLLKSARDELQLCVTFEDAQTCAVRHLQELVPGSSGATLIINNSRNMLEVAASWNNPESLADVFGLDTCCGLRTGRPRWRRPGESEINCNHFSGPPPANYVCIPLAAHGDTLGFVYLTSPTSEIAELALSRETLLEEMVELASMSFAGLRIRAKLESESIRDSLTGLFNRRFMEVALERELIRSARRNSPLALLMVDIDHFKTFNDSFGHEAGDSVLREVAECFAHTVRSEDIICRYGGEEFVIILPEISQELALERAEQIREHVSNLRIQFKGQVLRTISISIGVAMYPDPASDVHDLLRLADGALYQAKRAGRNRVHLAMHMVQA
jgi:diguanylate cyclase (GGDEF)-like protein